MAADWIKMRSALRSSPKVVRISSALNADLFRTVGGLHAVWSLVDEHTETGRLDGYTLQAIDDLIGWPGFSAAMESVEWLKVDAQGIDIPRFEEHNGKSAKRRAMELERKRSARTAQTVRIASGQIAETNADEKRTREEKSIHKDVRGGKQPKAKPEPTPEDHTIARLIFEGVRSAAPSAKEPHWPTWADTIRLMREQDKRTGEEIVAMFEWANQENFWRANILSPNTLRDKWTKLEAKRLSPPTQGNGQKPPAPPANCATCKLPIVPGMAYTNTDKGRVHDVCPKLF